MYKTARELTFASAWPGASLAYPLTLPAGSAVALIRNADGIRGDLFAAADVGQIARLTGNPHDAALRYVWIEAADVVRADGTPAASDLNARPRA